MGPAALAAAISPGCYRAVAPESQPVSLPAEIATTLLSPEGGWASMLLPAAATVPSF